MILSPYSKIIQRFFSLSSFRSGFIRSLTPQNQQSPLTSTRLSVLAAGSQGAPQALPFGRCRWRRKLSLWREAHPTAAEWTFPPLA